jgi:hypothetical protein
MLRFPAFGTQVQGASKRASQLALVVYGFSPHPVWSRMNIRDGGGRCFRGECMTRTASYHAVQGCNVNMQFGGATSRDLARQADQYGLSLALLHQGARLLHLSTFFSYVRLAACVRGGVLGPAYLDGTDLACSLKPNSFLYHYKFGDLKTRPSGKRRGPTREVRQVLGLPFYAPHCAQYRYQNSRMQYAFHGRHMR